MKREYCIFDDTKKCNDCGQCDVCDLNPNKKCNNCAKCLEMEGIDTKAIKIASVIEDEKDSEALQSLDYSHIDAELEQDEAMEEGMIDDEYTLEDDTETAASDYNYEEDEFAYDDEELEYIDDVDGLTEIFNDEERLKEVTEEVFPGFYRIRKI